MMYMGEGIEMETSFGDAVAQALLAAVPAVVDTRNATKGIAGGDVVKI